MYTLYLTWVAFQPKLCGPSWSSANYCVDRPTFLVGPYGPTWLLCMGWQIHCSIHCPCSVVPMVCLTALYGLTDPLSCPVPFGPDCLTWVLSVWTDSSTVQSTVLLGSDDLTWLLLYMYRCMGLTDPLSCLVLIVRLDCSVWTDRSTVQSTVLMIWLDYSCMGSWFNISAAQCCWGLEFNKHANRFSWKYNYMKIIHHTESCTCEQHDWNSELQWISTTKFMCTS